MSDSKSDAKAKFMARRKKKDPEIKEKPKTTEIPPKAVPSKVIENEWADEEPVVHKKQAFKIDGGETNEENKNENEVADWDDLNQDFLKKNEEETLKVMVVDETVKQQQKETKSAESISFGGARPVFGGGPPKFNKKKNDQKIDKEQFPDLGGKLEQKSEESEKSKQTGPLKYHGAPNRFAGLKEIEQQQEESSKANGHVEKKEVNRIIRKPRPEKDEFFSNFRSNNKNIAPPEPEKKDEPSQINGSEGGDRPRFNFTNNKKGAMTMAKAQEEALKRKAEVDQQVEQAPKEEKPSFKDKYVSRDKPTFSNSNKEDKPIKPKGKSKKVVKEKVTKEAADLKDVDDWGRGNLEDIL